MRGRGVVSSVVATLGMAPFWDDLPPLFQYIGNFAPSWALWEGTRALAALLLLILPTVAMGAAFGLLLRNCGGGDAETPARVARLYAANTMGAIGGALLGTFILAPMLGSETALRLVGLAEVGIAGLALVPAVGTLGVRRGFAAGLGAVYSARQVNGNLSGIPVFTPATLADLRSLAVSRPAASPAPAVVAAVPAPEPIDGAERMKAEWDERALENARHYIASAREDWDEAEFSESGRTSVQTTVGKDIDRCTGDRDAATLTALEIGCGVGRMTEHLANIFGRNHHNA